MRCLRPAQSGVLPGHQGATQGDEWPRWRVFRGSRNTRTERRTEARIGGWETLTRLEGAASHLGTPISAFPFRAPGPRPRPSPAPIHELTHPLPPRPPSPRRPPLRPQMCPPAPGRAGAAVCSGPSPARTSPPPSSSTCPRSSEQSPTRSRGSGSSVPRTSEDRTRPPRE